MTDNAGSVLFAERVERETKSGRRRAFGLNLIVVYYFLAVAYHLVADALGLVPEKDTVALGVFGALFPLGALGAAIWTRFPRSAGRVLVERTNQVLAQQRVEPDGRWVTSASGLFSMLTLVLTLVLGWKLTEISLYDLFSRDGLSGARRIFAALLQPNLGLGLVSSVLQAMVVTIFIALMATIIAIPVAFVTSFFCARNLTRDSAGAMFAYAFFRFVFNFTRSVEPIIWAIIFSVWVGIGPFAGMLALMLHSVAALAKLYSEQIENVDQGPIEAIQATGANKVQVVWFAVVPQVVLPFLSFTIYRWDINIRMATIIGLVGGGGVGTLLMQYQGLARWNEVGTIVIVIAIVVWAMDYLSARVREAIY